MKIAKSILLYIAVFIVAFFGLFFISIGSATIPQEQIKPHMMESAKYMCTRDSVFRIIDYVKASQIDRYADSITLSIAHQLDEEKPLASSMWTSFYGETSQYMNHYLLESVANDLPADHEYLRYWHGSAAMMRILHQFCNIRTIYIFHAILLIALGFLLVLLLIKNRYQVEAFAFVFSMILVSAWYVPLALEYTYSFLCMLIISILAVVCALRKQYQLMGILFLISGMATVYFDFLTTETLSLLIPLILIIRIDNRQEAVNININVRNYRNWLHTIQYVLLWGIGYLGMWVMKWICASFVLKINVMPYVTEHIAERIGGPVTSLEFTGNMYIDAIIRNVRCLFPYEFGILGAVLVIAFLFFAIMLPAISGKVSIRNKVNMSNILLLILIAVIPFIRFLILHNHAYRHYTFTHRALAATAMAIVLIVFEIVEMNRKSNRKAVPNETT